jgi:hypothetical protein
MPEVLAHFVGLLESVWSLLGPIGIVALIFGGLAFYFYEGDIEEPGEERERVRAGLEAGGDLRQYYVQLLTHGLNWLDRFFGDAGKAAFSLPSPFGNRERWPFWTGWSFDRCALLALIYPLASLFVVWVWTAESGAIGDRLGLKSGMVWWSRAIVAVAVLLMISAWWQAIRNEGFRALLFVSARSGAVAGAGAGAAERSEKRNRFGKFWSIFWPSALGAWYLGFVGSAWAGASSSQLSLSLMFGLVPIVNLPFDWFSLGLTRALLRRGCEPDAISPFWLGLLDFAFGLILLVALALALIAALQQADGILIHFGREPVANVTVLLHHIADDPRDPANFWAYFTLFSTLIPSALNAVIGAVSLIGWWWRPARLRVLSRFSLLDHPGRHLGTRRRIAVLLALQVGLGTALVGVALWGLWEMLLEAPYVLPFALKLLQRFAAALA